MSPAARFLVFIMGAGYYVTPALLGSPSETMVAQLITTQINDLLQWDLDRARRGSIDGYDRCPSCLQPVLGARPPDGQTV